MVVALLVASACSPAPTGVTVAAAAEASSANGVPDNVLLWTDPVTGCQWFVSDGSYNRGTMTPRYASARTIAGCGPQEAMQ